MFPKRTPITFCFKACENWNWGKVQLGSTSTEIAELFYRIYWLLFSYSVIAVIKFMQISFLNTKPVCLKIILLDWIFIADNTNSISSALIIERTWRILSVLLSIHYYLLYKFPSPSILLYLWSSVSEFTLTAYFPSSDNYMTM